jgi:hypothetical protein
MAEAPRPAFLISILRPLLFFALSCSSLCLLVVLLIVGSAPDAISPGLRSVTEQPVKQCAGHGAGTPFYPPSPAIDTIRPYG